LLLLFLRYKCGLLRLLPLISLARDTLLYLSIIRMDSLVAECTSYRELINLFLYSIRYFWQSSLLFDFWEERGKIWNPKEI